MDKTILDMQLKLASRLLHLEQASYNIVSGSKQEPKQVWEQAIYILQEMGLVEATSEKKKLPNWQALTAYLHTHNCQEGAAFLGNEFWQSAMKLYMCCQDIVVACQTRGDFESIQLRNQARAIIDELKIESPKKVRLKIKIYKKKPQISIR